MFIIVFLFRSFAYVTIKDRLPVILAKIADTVFRSKSWVKEEYGQVINSQKEICTHTECLTKLVK